MNIPIELQLWDSNDCASYFKMSREVFMRSKRFEPDFPEQTESSFGRQPRWSAIKVITWALK